MSFLARFPGYCANCDGRILPGEEVHYGLFDNLEHVQCDEAVEDRDAARPVCPECFMLKPCGCDDA